MGRYYAVSFSAVSVSAVQDLFELKPGAGAGTRIRLHALYLAQTSDVSSADSEVLRVSVVRRASGYTSGSGGSAPTPAALESADPAATFTAEANNTTQSSGGSGVTLCEDGWQILSPYVWSLPIPPDRKPSCITSEALVVTLTAPADALTASGTAIVEES